MSAVLNWLKANLYTVVFVVITIATPVALWFVTRGMNASVREEVEARASKISELERLRKASVSFEYPVPGNEPVNATIAINQRFLDRYEEVVGQVREDAQRVQEEVLRINRKGRGILMPRLFPSPPPREIETIPVDMYQAVRRAYEDLLVDVNAGPPPSTGEMVDELAAARDRYKTQFLVKEAREELTADEQAWLTEQLTKTRLSKYADRASQLKLYAGLEALSVPLEADTPESASGDNMALLFEWQWNYWIDEDIVRALAAANEDYRSVVDAPVKHIESVVPLGEPSKSSGGGATAGAPGPTGGFGAASGTGRRSRGRSSSSADDSGAPAVKADPSQEIQPVYAASFTGRTTNPLYDVRLVEVVVVADSARVPEVFDALARYNFMTVLDVQLEPVDQYGAIRGGYFYGGVPVSRLTMIVETVWLREWTSEFMPDVVKRSLGIPVENKQNGG